jgi:O-antigen/teichoic acid export membrane protein
MKRFGDKLTVNAIALIVGTVATNVLGLAFWAVAARSYTPTEVGGAFAELAALTLLASLSQLNLTNIFVRFLPAAGRFTARFVRRGYVAVAVVATLAGIAIAASGATGSVIGRGVVPHVLFVIAVPLFALFALQDAVMASLRITTWVPVENIICAVAKLALLPLILFGATRTGIVVSWLIPTAIAVAVVSSLLFRRAVATVSRVETGHVPAPRKLASFVAAEYMTNVTGVLSSQLMPLIVVWRLSSTFNAYFAIPWLACSAISLVMWNVGMSFIVETVTAAEHSARRLKRSIQLWVLVLAGAVVGCVVIGPFVLPIVGHAYATHATTLLRLIGVAAPLQLVTILYQAFAWLDQRVWLLLAIQVVTSAAFLALSIALLGPYGLTGVGWAYLITQAAQAVVMAPVVWSRITRIRLAKAPIRLDRAY